MKQTTRNKINISLQYIPKLYFTLQIILGILAAFWILFNHQPKTGDDVEHLHSAWLVFEGKIPYVDFFQHHNPLLWYLFAPLVGFFAYNIAIFDIVRIISTLVLFVTIFITAKIVQKFICNDKYAGLLTVASIFPSYIALSGQDFRPDNYMVASFMIGLYFFLDYLQNLKKRTIIISFMSMFICFMFMQKSVFFLGVFGLEVLVLLALKKVRGKDFAIALILPFISCLLFILWLMSHQMVERYWLSNFIFNLYIPDVYDGLSEKTVPEFYGLTALATVGFFYFMKYGNTAVRLVCFIWMSEAIQRFCYFSLDRHYYYFLDIMNAILVGGLAYRLICRWQWVACIFMMLAMAATWKFAIYCRQNKLPSEYHRYVTPKYIIENTNRCDAVLNGYGLTYGIFSRDLTYYWNLNGQLDVIGDKIGLAPLPDLNIVTEKYLPKIIYTGPYWHEKWHKRHHDIAVHWIKPDIRDKYYQQSIFVDIFILKPEYQNKRRCRYDAQTQSWHYYNKE